MKKIFYVAGRTGGPFFPIPAVIDALSEYQPIIIGVKKGYEERVSKNKSYTFYTLPQTRLRISSFKREKISETIFNYLDLLPNLIKMAWSVLKSLYLLITHRPAGIYATGSFLAVPLVFAAQITNFLRITRTKVFVHQQDPLPGISNKIITRWSDVLSCVFEYTKNTFPRFARALIIQNPISVSEYQPLEAEEKKMFQKKQAFLAKFVNKPSSKPLLLVFGGGSGSEDINVWLVKNKENMLNKFRIVHLTGILQEKQLAHIDHPDYFRMQALLNGEMPTMLKYADVVLCRSGLATITELMYLRKPAYLVPLPSTHQEKNAELVEKYFYILHQDNRPEWFEKIESSYPTHFSSINYSLDTHYLDLEAYFDALKKTLQEK